MAISRGEKAIVTDDSGYLSDESEFYGDETTKLELEARANEFNVSEWWENRDQTLIDIAQQNIVEQADKANRVATTLFNPYDGLPGGRQLSETVEGFLQRLPPATTQLSNEIPWIRISNPYRKAPKQAARNGALTQDEAPPDEDSQWAQFVVLGNNLLQELVGLRHEIEKKNIGKAKAIITKAVNKERDAIVKRILDGASELHCTSGKWMIFCPPHEVNEVWAAIARATANNDLGTAAKVAPDEGVDRKDRLICIYTKDFADMTDVSKVLLNLKELGLVVTNGRGIYYKCDAYTYLGITSTNEYGIKASMYNSTDVFKLGKAKDGKALD